MTVFSVSRWLPICCLLTGLAGCSDGVQIDTDTGGSTTGEDSGGGDDSDTGQPAGTGVLPDLAPHASGFKGIHYSGSDQCSTCHDDLQDAEGNDISMVRDWSGSMMANASRDPYWIAKVASESERSPQLQSTLGDTCSRCHAPMANDTARKSQLEISLQSGGLLDASNALFDHAMDGVSCTLCHQLDDDGLLGTPEGSSGNFTVLEQDNLSDRPAYGPYSDPNGVYMQSQVRFNPVYGAHMSRSDVCASCHDLQTPAGGHGGAQDGSATAFFPEQMVFSEWRNSSFAEGGDNEQTCQGCHMPVVSGEVMLANQGGGVPREGFSRHTFLGANTVMQSMLMQYRDELGISVPAARFTESIARNRDFLRSSAAVDIAETEWQDGQLAIRVLVQNRTGHKLPSGFPSRRAYVHLVVSDDAGNIVFESGALNRDGSVVGLDADDDSSRYEPHYEVINSAEQVQVYEAIMGDASQRVTHTLMQASAYLKDNRLLPAGFDKASAPDVIRTAGQAVDDSDFQAGGDEIRYQLSLPATGGYTVLAELIYQPLAFGHIQDLFADVQLPAVDQFKTMFDASQLKAETIASDSVLVP